jgi:UDP-N-acetylmuramate dehydrogenase
MEEKKRQFRLLAKTVRGRLLYDEPLSGHTSFKIGGPADFYFFPKDLEDLVSVVQVCETESIPRFVIGKGTNLLVSDAGFRGVVIDLSESFSMIHSREFTVTAGAGVQLWDLLLYCTERGLSGMESLAGIPGGVGGGIRLNAGAFGWEIKDCLENVAFVEAKGSVIMRPREDIRMDYRRTDLPADAVIVQAQFQMKEGSPAEMKTVQEDILNKRREKQPLSLPSAGSVFKRPQGDYAGRLIEEAGLKGLRFGDAMVSGKHANFIVNCQSASASDVMRLIIEIKKRVFDRFGLRLELEIHFLGFKEEKQ